MTTDVAAHTIVVVPTYNERENLPELVRRVKALGVPGLQLLIMDDNSPDGTGTLADELAAADPGFLSVEHRPGKLGLGPAYVHGYRIALERGADLVIQMDADFSHPIEKIPVLLERAREYDVVIGSRYTTGSSLDERWGPLRRALSGGGNALARAVTGLPLNDVTGGFRCFRRSVLQDIDWAKVRSTGFVFQVETAYLAHRAGARFCETPIHFADRTAGASKMSLKIVWEAFWRVWDLRFRA